MDHIEYNGPFSRLFLELDIWQFFWEYFRTYGNIWQYLKISGNGNIQKYLRKTEFKLIAGGEDWGGVVRNRREPEAAWDLGGEGKEEGGEIPGKAAMQYKKVEKRENSKLKK